MKANLWGSACRFAFVLLSVLLTATNIVAQKSEPSLATRAGSTELTLFAGVSALAGSETNGFGVDVNTGTPAGGRVAYNFTAHQAAEFSIANPLSLSVNYLYNFSPIGRKWVLCATAGIGGSRNEISLSDNNQAAQINPNLMQNGPERRQTVFTGNFGGGVKYFLNDKIALRFDVRDQIGHYHATFSNVVGVPGGIVSVSKTPNDFQITGGIVFRFGGER